MKTADLALARIVAQRLAGPKCEDPAQAVEWLGCVQGQDLPGALVSVALRTKERSLARVREQLDAGQIVRSWPMRGTLHLVPARDVGWMCSLTAERMHAQAAQRRAQLGLDDAMIARAEELVRSALAEAGPLTRSEVLTLWEPDGLVEVKGRGYHLLSLLCYTGVLTLGPLRGGEQCFVELDQWVPDPNRLERAEALGRWATRYFSSHGPATLADFARWTGLTMTEVRTAVAEARENLETITVDDTEYLVDPALPDLLKKHRRQANGLLLLPGFDELILGYKDRSCTLDRDRETDIVPGRNGVFKPTVVRGGRVCGTWRRVRSAKAEQIEATFFDDAKPPSPDDVVRAYRRLP